MAATNFTTMHGMPPLPSYTIKPAPDLLSFIPDHYLAVALPVVAYWTTSMFFHVIDVYDIFPQYRLHTPAEISKRNRATRGEVLFDVILQHVIQSVVGVASAYFEGHPTHGTEAYDVAVWGRRIRHAQSVVPLALSAVGINSSALAAKVGGSSSVFQSVLLGGKYPQFTQMLQLQGQSIVAPAFAPWEMALAQFVYWIGIPAIRLFVAILILDSWQYWLHMTMHKFKWLYTHLHSRHHRLYVPYAFGALYNHPLEGFVMDTLGSGLAYILAGLSIRQTMIFFVVCSIKTVDDHCGYAFPWDPLQHITKNNAAYHDIHHQSWGIKTNFSQPFFTFWDEIRGTQWKGDVSLKYEMSRVAAEKWLSRKQTDAPVESSSSLLAEEKKPAVKKSDPLRLTDVILTPRTEDSPKQRRSPLKKAEHHIKELRSSISGGVNWQRDVYAS